MNKVFKDNFEPLSYDLIDVNGEKKTITQKIRITPDVSDQIESIIAEKDITSSQKIVEQFIMIFGEDELFWRKFETSFLGNLIQEFSKDMSKKK